jgi:hypothetical protein
MILLMNPFQTLVVSFEVKPMGLQHCLNNSLGCEHEVDGIFISLFSMNFVHVFVEKIGSMQPNLIL